MESQGALLTKMLEETRPVSLMNINVKILTKALANWIQQCMKRIEHHNHVKFIPGMQGCFNIWKSNKFILTDKQKAYVIVVEETFDEIQVTFYS